MNVMTGGEDKFLFYFWCVKLTITEDQITTIKCRLLKNVVYSYEKRTKSINPKEVRGSDETILLSV